VISGLIFTKLISSFGAGPAALAWPAMAREAVAATAARVFLSADIVKFLIGGFEIASI
jgi:hypothetical protein